MLEHTAKPAVFRETSWHHDSSSQGHVQTITKRSPYTYRVKEKPFRLFSDLNFFSSISFFLFFLSLCLNRGNPLLLTGQQSWLSGWCVTQLSKCLCEQCVSREEVRGSPMWSRRDLKDVATSPPHCPAAFSSLAAWGMCFNQEPSPQPRSERCQSSLSLCHSTLLLLAVSLTHTETHPPRQSILSLSLFFSPPFLAVLTDQITSPLFQVVERVFCVLPYSISINFCSSSVRNLYFWMTQRTT